MGISQLRGGGLKQSGASICNLGENRHMSQSEDNKFKSQSLFSSSRDEEHSLDNASQRQQQEKQKRMRVFLRFGLPLCVLILIGIVIFLWKPIKYTIFPPKYPNMAEPPEMNMAGKDDKETIGNPDAKIVIELQVPDKALVPESRMEQIYDAVYAKPSQVCLIMKIGPAVGNPCFMINGQTELEMLTKEDEIAKVSPMKLTDPQFRELLAQIYDTVYGTSVNPLEVQTAEQHRNFMNMMLDGQKVTMPGSDSEISIDDIQKQMQEDRQNLTETLILPGMDINKD